MNHLTAPVARVNDGILFGEGGLNDPELEACVRRASFEVLGRQPERLEPLRGGLAARRFFRLVFAGGEPATLVARVDLPEDPAGRPEGVPPEPALEPVRRVLEAHGLPVPRRLGGVPGIDLLEDLGDHSLAAELPTASRERRRALYQEALGLLAGLQRIAISELPDPTRRLDGRLIAYKGRLFARWSLPLALGRPPRASETRCVEDAFAWIARALEEAPHPLAHRDFQSRNLHLHARPGSSTRIFLIDFQGAFAAPPEYDVVSLLCDSYVDLAAGEVDRLCAWVRPRLPSAPDAEGFARRFDLLTLTRKAKDHARYASARHAERDPGYLGPAMGRAARSLHAAARRTAGLDPCLRSLAELVLALPESPCAP